MDPYEWWLRCLSLTISEIQEDKDAYDLLSTRTPLKVAVA
jgi:hypothetical protein